MKQEVGFGVLLGSVARLLASALIPFVATGVIGWILFAVTPLTLAQGIFVAVTTFVVSVVAVEPYSAASINTMLSVALAIALLMATLSALLAWPVDLLTSLTRWEATLYALAVFNAVAYLMLRQVATAMSWIDELALMAPEPDEEDEEPVIDLQPAKPNDAKRRRRRQRTAQWHQS